MTMCACDGEPVEMRTNATLRARITHKCSECGKDIAPGQEYRLLVGKADGDHFKIKQCAFCARVADDIARMSYCNALGDLWAIVNRIESEK